MHRIGLCGGRIHEANQNRRLLDLGYRGAQWVPSGPQRGTDRARFVDQQSLLVAVAFSVFSSFGQIAYVWASFTRNERIKFAILIVVALPFLFGLVITMGLFWWPWGLLIVILYMPWQRIDAAIGSGRPRLPGFPPDARAQRTWFLTATAALIGIHIFAVATVQEYEPLFSNYPMYAAPMRAGSIDEDQLLETLRKQGRNGAGTMHLVLEDGTERDVSMRQWFAMFLRGILPYTVAIDCALDPRAVEARFGLRRYARDGDRLILLLTETIRVKRCR
jgi:hypothetical protein